jgi:Ser/Thr protein kinase RdoA (MazF antagonist)
MVETKQDLVPPDIIEAYYPEGVTQFARIPGGEVNITFLVTSADGQKTILQRLSPVYDERVSEDYAAVATHLTSRGWEMASVHKTHDGISYLVDDTGQLWRSFGYIESAPGRDQEGNLEACTALAGLLGTLHRDLADFDYQPRFERRNKGGNYQINKLQALLPQITDPAHHELAVRMLDLVQKDTIDDRPSQIIHADPRVGNALFRGGKPFTFIDWDGYKQANPLVDVGDMLQSTTGEVITKGSGSCSIEELYPVIEAYYETAKPVADMLTFQKQALAAARVIALNLGMRHLIDSVEDTYFVWDSSRFDSRFDFNISCAQRQRRIYDVLADQ